MLAISDGVFNAALMRFRSEVRNFAESLARKQAANMPDAAKVVREIVPGVGQIASKSNGNVVEPARMTGGSQAPVPPRLDAAHMVQKMTTIAQDRVAHLAIAGNSIYDGLYAIKCSF